MEGHLLWWRSCERCLHTCMGKCCMRAYVGKRFLSCSFIEELFGVPTTARGGSCGHVFGWKKKGEGFFFGCCCKECEVGLDGRGQRGAEWRHEEREIHNAEMKTCVMELQRWIDKGETRFGRRKWYSTERVSCH